MLKRDYSVPGPVVVLILFLSFVAGLMSGRVRHYVYEVVYESEVKVTVEELVKPECLK